MQERTRLSPAQDQGNPQVLIRTYLGILIVLAIILSTSVFLYDSLSYSDLLPVAVFAVLSLIAELRPVNLGRFHGAISMGTALDLSALFICGPAVMLVSALLSEVIINIVLKRGGWRTAFNTVQLLVTNAVTGLTYYFLRPGTGPLLFEQDMPAIAVAVSLRLFVNLTAIAVAFAIQRHCPVWETGKELFRKAPLAHYLVQAPLGILAALIYQYQPAAVILALVPLYINYVGIRRYAALMAMNDQLEEMVAERTEDLVVLNEKLETAYKRLQTEEDKRRQLVASISHDLRTPLSSVQGYVEALLDGVARTEAERRRYLRVIHDKTQMLDRLIDDLFQLARLESGQLEMKFHQGLLQEFIPQVLSHWRVEIERAGLKLEQDYQEDIPPVLFDPDRLKQVVSNLLSNAIRHTPPPGTIRVKAWAEGDRAFFTVADSGEGIAPEDLPFIFERFYRGEKSRSRRGGGSGLGLAIVKEIVAAHNGEVSAHSRKGEGAELNVTLPIYSPPPKQS